MRNMAISRILVLIISLAVHSCSSVDFEKTGQTPSPNYAQNLSVDKVNTSRSSEPDHAIWTTRIGSIELRWNTDDLIIDGLHGNGLFSMKESAKRSFETVKMRAGKIEDCSYSQEIRLKSVVGRLISIENRSRFSYSFSVDGHEVSGPYSDYTTLITIDVLDARDESGEIKPTKLETVFNKEEVFRELIEEKPISRALREQSQGRMPTDFNEFIEFLKKRNGLLFDDYRYAIYDDFTEHFEFESVNHDNVTIKLTLPSANRTNQENYCAYLTFEIPSEIRHDLEKANRLEFGFLGSDADHLFGKRTTKIEYRCK